MKWWRVSWVGPWTAVPTPTCGWTDQSQAYKQAQYQAGATARGPAGLATSDAIANSTLPFTNLESSCKSLPQVLARQSATWEPGTIIPACPPVFPLPDTLVPNAAGNEALAENPLASAPSCFRADALRHDPTTQGRRRHAGQAKIQQQRFDADYDGASPLPHSEMSTKLGRSKSPGGSSPEMGDSWPPSSERLAAMHPRTRFGHPPSSVLRLIDTRRASPKWPLREVVGRRCRCGITAGRSSCPKLRMLSAATIRAPASKWDKHHGFCQRSADGCHGWYRAPASQALTTPGPSPSLRMLSGGGAQFVLLQDVCARYRTVECILEGCR